MSPTRPGAPVRGRIRPALVAGMGLLVALQGCGERGPEPDVLDDSTYVQVMARLSYIRQVADRSGSPDSLRWADSARPAVLEDFGVGGEELERYAALHGDDPRHMTEVWERIGDVLDDILGRAARIGGPPDLGRGVLRPPPPADSVGPDSAEPATPEPVEPATPDSVERPEGVAP